MGRPVRATITLYPIGIPVRATITLCPIGRPVRATITLYPIGRPVRATITLYPIGRPVRATVTLYPIGRPYRVNKGYYKYIGYLYTCVVSEQKDFLSWAEDIVYRLEEHEKVSSLQHFRCITCYQ